ncbi:MAG TPA: GAF domain-containing protein [Longimicrobiaceae bacterium]|nr:GAF domain-containing protein [Longimicrobiaceae bacterium]
MRAETRIPVPGVVSAMPDGGWHSRGTSAQTGNGAGPVAAEEGPAEADLDHFVRLAALTLGAEVAAVSLALPDQQLFEICIRLPDLRAVRRKRALSGSLARYTLEADEPLVVEDALAFPLELDGAALQDGIRTYVGVPLRPTAAGTHVPGTLCVAGYAPRAWAPGEIEVLRIIAGSIVEQIDLRGAIRRMEREQRDQVGRERRLALQQLALGLRHELNNALAGLILETELLSGGGTGYDRYRESVASIQGQVWRIHEVLRRLDDVDALRTKPYLDRGLMIDLSQPGGVPDRR